MNNSCIKQNGERFEEERIEYRFIMRNRIFKIRLRQALQYVQLLVEWMNHQYQHIDRAKPIQIQHKNTLKFMNIVHINI